MIRAALPWVLAGLVLFPFAARAQPSADEQARIHFQAGTNYFNIADYEAALREYTRAYELAGRPALLHNIYLCHERLGNLEEAIDFLERYLSSGGDIARRETLEQRLANMRRRLEARASETETVPPPEEQGHGTPITEEEVLGEEPAPDEGGTTEGSGVEETAEATTSGVEGTGASAAPMDEPPSGLSAPALASFVVAGVGLASFAVFGGLALAEDGSLEDECDGTCREEDTDGLRTLMVLADVSLGIGLAAGVTGLVLLLTGDDAPADDDVAGVSPWLGPDGAGLRGRMAF